MVKLIFGMSVQETGSFAVESEQLYFLKENLKVPVNTKHSKFLVSGRGLARQQENTQVPAKLFPPLLDDRWIVRSAIPGVVTYLTRVYIAYCVTHLYANKNYARDERHVMILFWFLFVCFLFCFLFLFFCFVFCLFVCFLGLKYLFS